MRNCPYVLPKARFLLTLFWNPMVSKAQEMLLLSSLPNLYCGTKAQPHSVGPKKLSKSLFRFSLLSLSKTYFCSNYGLPRAQHITTSPLSLNSKNLAIYVMD